MSKWFHTYQAVKVATITIDTISYPDCTLGRLWVDGFQCFTLERPWVDNKQNVSCIPSGEYQYFFRKSPSNGDVLELKGVPGRSFIQIHKGNYVHQIAGCILVGDGVKDINGDGKPDVTNSTNTLRKLLSIAGDSGTVRINGCNRDYTIPR